MAVVSLEALREYYIDLGKPKSGARIFFPARLFNGRSYGRTVVHPIFFGLMGYYYFVIIMGYALRAPLIFMHV